MLVNLSSRGSIYAALAGAIAMVPAQGGVQHLVSSKHSPFQSHVSQRAPIILQNALRSCGVGALLTSLVDRQR